MAGRYSDPGPDAICACCDRPRRDHGGPKKLGLCPGENGINGKRFALRDEDRVYRPYERRPGSPSRAFRIYDMALWDRFGELAGTERSAILRDFIAWFVGLPDAELPKRPEVIRTAEGDVGGPPPHSRA